MNSTIAYNLTDVIIGPYEGIQSPVSCGVLKFFTVYSMIMFSLSLSFNSLLLYAFIKNQKLRSPVNMFILALTVCNIFATLSEMQFIVPSTYLCRWAHGWKGCVISGFIMYTVGLLQINLVAVISMERYYIIAKPLNIKTITYKTTGVLISAVIAKCLFFTVAPLLGWSKYSLELSLIQCGVEWAERSWNVQSYNFVIFITDYFIPVGLVGFCSFKLLAIVKAMPTMNHDDEKVKAKMEQERQLTITMLVYIAGFAIAWTPYTITSFMVVVFGEHSVHPLGSFMPAMFAKTSMAWGAMFFIFSNKAIRATIFGGEHHVAKEQDMRTVTQQQSHISHASHGSNA